MTSTSISLIQTKKEVYDISNTRERIKQYFEENKYLNLENIHNFIDFINFSSIIKSEDEYISLYSYLLEYQIDYNSNINYINLEFNKENTPNTNNDESIINLNPCLYAFDELFDLSCKDNYQIESQSRIDIVDISNSTDHNMIENDINTENYSQTQVKNENLYGNHHQIKKKLSFRIKENKKKTEEVSNKNMFLVIYKRIISSITEDSLYNIKLLLELIFSPDFTYQYITDSSPNVTQRKFSIPDINIILSQYPYINLSCMEFICIISYILDIELSSIYDINQIDYDMSTEILSQIDSHGHSNTSITNKDLPIFNNKNQQNPSEKQGNSIEILIKELRNGYNDIEESGLLLKYEELEDSFQQLINNDSKSDSIIRLVLEVSQYISFTIKNQIQTDLVKLKKKQFLEYENETSVVEALIGNMNLIELKTGDIQTFLYNQMTILKKHKSEMYSFGNKLSSFEQSFKNATIIFSFFEKFANDVNEKMKGKGFNDNVNMELLSKIHEESDYYMKENMNLKEKLKEVEEDNSNKTKRLLMANEKMKECEVELNEIKSKMKRMKIENETILKGKMIIKEENTTLNEKISSVLEQKLILQTKVERLEYLIKMSNLNKTEMKNKKSVDFISYSNKKRLIFESDFKKENQNDKDNTEIFNEDYLNNETFISKTETSIDDESSIKLKTIRNLSVHNYTSSNLYDISKDKDSQIKQLEKKILILNEVIEGNSKKIYLINKENENLTVKNKELIEDISIMMELKAENSRLFLKSNELKVVNEVVSFSFLSNTDLFNHSNKYKQVKSHIRSSSEVIINKTYNNTVNFSLLTERKFENLVIFPSERLYLEAKITNNKHKKKNTCLIGTVNDEKRKNFFKEEIQSRIKDRFEDELMTKSIKINSNSINNNKTFLKNMNFNMEKTNSYLINGTPKRVYSIKPSLSRSILKEMTNERSSSYIKTSQKDEEKDEKDEEKGTNFDFLNIKNVSFIDNFLISCNESKKYIYSSYINQFIDINSLSKKKILLTSKTIYILNHADNYILDKIPYRSIRSISICTTNNNLLSIHMKESLRDDIIFEDYHRRDLVNFLIFLFKNPTSNLVNDIDVIKNDDDEKLKISIEYSSSIRVKLNNQIMNLINNKNKSIFSMGKFDNCIKFGYVRVLTSSLFGKSYLERFACLSNIGLILFESSNKTIPVDYYDLINYQVEILSFKKENYSLDDDFTDFPMENSVNLTKIEDFYHYSKDPDRILFEIKSQIGKSVIFQAGNRFEADSWVREIKRFVVENQIKDKVNVVEIYV